MTDTAFKARAGRGLRRSPSVHPLCRPHPLAASQTQEPTRKPRACARLSPDLGPSQPTEVLNHSPPPPLPDGLCALWLQEDPGALLSPLLPAEPQLAARWRLDCGLSWATTWGSLEGYLCVWVEGSGLEKQTGPRRRDLEVGWGLEGSVHCGQRETKADPQPGHPAVTPDPPR